MAVLASTPDEHCVSTEAYPVSGLSQRLVVVRAVMPMLISRKSTL